MEVNVRTNNLSVAILVLSLLGCHKQYNCRYIPQACPAFEINIKNVNLPPKQKYGYIPGCINGRLVTVEKCEVETTGAVYTRYEDFIQGQISVTRLVSGNEVLSQSCMDLNTHVTKLEGPALETTCINHWWYNFDYYCDETEDLSHQVVLACDEPECFDFFGNKISCNLYDGPDDGPNCYDWKGREEECP